VDDDDDDDEGFDFERDVDGDDGFVRWFWDEFWAERRNGFKGV
jgi:hypothetical protein